MVSIRYYSPLYELAWFCWSWNLGDGIALEFLERSLMAFSVLRQIVKFLLLLLLYIRQFRLYNFRIAFNEQTLEDLTVNYAMQGILLRLLLQRLLCIFL